MIELPHFFVGVCLKVHRAGETGNVPVAGLVHCGERVEESCPVGMEGHDGGQEALSKRVRDKIRRHSAPVFIS